MQTQTGIYWELVENGWGAGFNNECVCRLLNAVSLGNSLMIHCLNIKLCMPTVSTGSRHSVLSSENRKSPPEIYLMLPYYYVG